MVDNWVFCYENIASIANKHSVTKWKNILDLFCNLDVLSLFFIISVGYLTFHWFRGARWSSGCALPSEWSKVQNSAQGRILNHDICSVRTPDGCRIVGNNWWVVLANRVRVMNPA